MAGRSLSRSRKAPRRRVAQLVGGRSPRADGRGRGWSRVSAGEIAAAGGGAWPMSAEGGPCKGARPSPIEGGSGRGVASACRERPGRGCGLCLQRAGPGGVVCACRGRGSPQRGQRRLRVLCEPLLRPVHSSSDSRGAGNRTPQQPHAASATSSSSHHLSRRRGAASGTYHHPGRAGARARARARPGPAAPGARPRAGAASGAAGPGP